MATDTRARMLEAAARLIQERGFHGTSLNDILAASGAPRGSLYFHFPGGKDELMCEAMVREVAQLSALLREIFDTAPDPASGIRAYIDGAADAMRDSGFVVGCPVAPVVLDAPRTATALVEACRQAFDEWHGMIVEALVKEGVDPERAGRLATMSISCTEGALLMARAARDITPIRVVAKEMEALIRKALPWRRGRKAG